MNLLTKEECEKALETLSSPPYESSCGGCICGVSDCGDCPNNKANKLLNQLIKEHFDNPPLDFGQFKPNMWIWDIKRKQWMQVYSGSYVMHGEKWLDVYTVGYDEVEDIKYEDDRFYRKECYHE